MSFVAAPPAEPPATVEDAVAGDGWYPALSIQSFRDAQRIPETASGKRVREALLGGMVSASVGLAAWRAVREEEGAADLAATSEVTIGGENRAVILWRRAVHAFAAADLAETHTDISATDAGRDRNALREDPCDALRREATAALRDLMGKTRCRVALK
ncbi:MAG: head completion/stabilization protein [Novosphingobium sp.]|nr:head completion/stabilization protein [Novosphingobium sp.]